MNFNQQLTNSLIIGTQSKTRRKLFADAGLIFQYQSPNINEEQILLGNKIISSQQALRLAGEKALHLSQIYKNSIIVCFDTTVHINNKTIFFHCISNYPLNPINSNLNYITKLKKIFKGYSIGYSSHESDIFNCIISLSKNIEYIERHITINKNSKGLDHSSSSDFKELKNLCFYANNYNEISNSKNYRYVNQGEKINLQNLGKSAYANKDIDVNKKINLKDISFLSPKVSLEKNEILKYLKTPNKKFLKKGDEITIENFFTTKKFNDSSRKFCNKKNISIPIRPSDYKLIDNVFEIDNYEFHLSFNDVLKFNIKEIDKKILKSKKFTVHGPDYCDSNNINTESKTPLTSDGVQTGMRNDTLARLVGKWILEGWGMREVVIKALDWNQTNTPPMTVQEVLQTANSI